MKKKKALTLLVMVTSLIAAGCGKELTLVTDQVEVELGSELDTMATNYVADEKLAEDATLDFSAVNTLKAGTYPVTVTYKDQTATFDVVVTDTTAPVVEFVDAVTVEAGTSLSAQEVIANVTELSGTVEVTIAEPEAVAEESVEDESEAVESIEIAKETETVEVDATEAEESTQVVAEVADQSTELMLEPFTVGAVLCTNDYVILAETGEYDALVTVADASGNTAEALIHIVVGEAPTISGVEDMTVTLGTEEVDYLEGVTATDCNGNDITDKIVCDSDTVDLENAGQYGITYTVTDENGFEKIESAIVTVKEKNSGSTTSSRRGSSNNTSSTTGSTASSATSTSTGNTSSSNASTNTSSGNTSTSSASTQTTTTTPSTDTSTSSSTTTTTPTPSADSSTTTTTPSTDTSTSSSTTTTTPSTDTTTTTNPWDVPMTEPDNVVEGDSSLLDNTGTGGQGTGEAIGGGDF